MTAPVEFDRHTYGLRLQKHQTERCRSYVLLRVITAWKKQRQHGRWLRCASAVYADYSGAGRAVHASGKTGTRARGPTVRGLPVGARRRAGTIAVRPPDLHTTRRAGVKAHRQSAETRGHCFALEYGTVCIPRAIVPTHTPAYVPPSQFFDCCTAASSKEFKSARCACAATIRAVEFWLAADISIHAARFCPHILRRRAYAAGCAATAAQDKRAGFGGFFPTHSRAGMRRR